MLSSIKNADLRNFWGFLLLKMLKQGTVGNILLEMLKKVPAKARLGSSIAQKAKIRYAWGFNLFNILKEGTTGVLHCGKYQNKAQLKYGWGLLLFKKQK